MSDYELKTWAWCFRQALRYPTGSPRRRLWRLAGSLFLWWE